MRKYLSVFLMRLKMETHYRGAALGGIICQVFFGLILIALYRALYSGKAQAVPLSSVVTYVWLQQAFFRMLLSSDAELADRIRSGGIAYDLCRPVDMYGFYYMRIMAQKLVGSMLRGVPMLLIAALLPGGLSIAPPASFPALLLSLLALALGLLCVSAIENITVAFTMRTMDPRGVQALLNLLMMILAGNVLPLTMYPDSWQRLIALTPYAQLLDVPIRLYTGGYAVSDAPGALMVQLCWTAVLIASGRALWRMNARRLTIQGG